jgi:hypothetical protein
MRIASECTPEGLMEPDFRVRSFEIANPNLSPDNSSSSQALVDSSGAPPLGSDVDASDPRGTCL